MTTETPHVTPAAAPEQAAGNLRSGLRAMIGKGLRQFGLLGALSGLGIAVALAFMVGRNLQGPAEMMNSGEFEGIWNGVTATFMFGSPLVALLLGFLQIFPELRRDLWAFLIHRPASRATLFWGKALAGLLLYLAATLIPLGLCALWIRTPGNVAGPFDPRLTLGALAGILIGMPFYFAGMLTALRPARWYGSRALPIPAAIILAAFTATLSEFWQAALASLVIAAVFCLAACGSFLTTGIYETQPRPARAALGTVVYVGMVVTLVVLAVLGIAAYRAAFPPVVSVPYPAVSVPFPAQYQTTQYQITWSGQIVRETQDSAGYIVSVQALDASPVQMPPRERGLSRSQQGLTQEDFLLQNYVYAAAAQTNSFTNPSRYVVQVADESDNAQLYYVQGTGQFYRYDEQTRFLTNRFIQPGLMQPLVDTESIVYNGISDTLLVFPHSLWRLLSNNYTFITTLKPIPAELHGALVERVASLEYIEPPMNDTSAAVPLGFLTATRRAYLVLSLRGDVLFTVPRLPWQGTFFFVAVTPDEKRFFFWWKTGGPNTSEQVFEYNRQGELVRHVLLPPITETKEHVTGPEEHNSVDVAMPGSLVGLFVPPVICGSMIWVNGERSSGESGWTALMHLPLEIKLLCLMSLVSGFPGAFLAWRIGLRCAYSRAGLWAWACGAFWLGLSGPLLMLCLREWPARENCPNCHRLRVVTREHCEHCGASFAPVPRDGTEIFADDNAASGE